MKRSPYLNTPKTSINQPKNYFQNGCQQTIFDLQNRSRDQNMKKKTLSQQIFALHLAQSRRKWKHNKTKYWVQVDSTLCS